MAADDSHRYNGEQTRAFTMVNARELSPDAVKDALRSGNFYASEGPRFRSIGIDGGEVRVECSPVETILFLSNTVWCDDRVFTGKRTGAICRAEAACRTEAVYRVKATDRYVRVVLIDSSGGKAWSSPIPLGGAE